MIVQKTFNLILLLGVVLFGLSGQIFAQTGVSGTYILYVEGQPVAEENYASEKLADGSIKTIAQAAAGNNATKFTTIIKDNQPVDFTIESNGTKVLTTTFSGGEAKTLITGQPEKIVKTASTVILENGVWSHFVNLLAQYDAGKGGVQYFNAFLPSQSLNLAISLESTENSVAQVSGQTISLLKYRLVFPKNNTIVEILADKTGVPLLIAIPSQQVTVIKKGFEALRESKAVSKAAAQNFSGEFSSEEVSFPNGKISLAGTLTLPKNDKKLFPAIVIITGSGGQDRNGSTIFNLYKQIAESLSRAGVAVLRVDDRGMGKSTIIKEKAADTSYRDLISDSLAAFNYLMTRNEIDKAKIGLLGHSEGAETALTIAAEDKRVAAIVLMAGTSRPLSESVLEQEIYQRALQETVNASNKTEVMPIAQTLAKQFETAGLEANANNPKLSWFRQHLLSNPAQLAQKVKCPVLIVQGERDSLVLAYHSIELAKALSKSGNQNVNLRILPNLTHLFTPISDKTEDATKISQEMLRTLQNWAFATLVK